jgi:O-methyltransferase involved in polyketide biosynthesis
MLWSLHHRACESRRDDGVIADPQCVRIESAIDYDFRRHFGNPRGSLAMRAAEIDRALRAWLEHHPDGIVVSLGEGLETQGSRVDNGRMRWLSVDLPDAIRLRERFLAPTHRFRHVAVSALDPAWMDEVDPSSGVFIVAQGLLMYLAPEKVRALFAAIADRFPGADLVFDTIPKWFSDLTLLGLHQTAHYRLPPMPWGINRDDVEPTLRRWHAGVARVAFLTYRSPRGFGRLLAQMANRIPMARHGVPCLVHVKIAEADGPSAKVGAISQHCVPGQVPEKVEAFSSAGMVMLKQSGHAGRQMLRHASDEVMTTARAAIEMTACSNPAALMEAQGRFARAWFGRAASRWVAMGLGAIEAQSAAMALIRQTVVANAERLGR